MQRVGDACRIDRALRCAQCLPEHLPAEHEAGADVSALAAKEVVFDAFKAQQVQQFGNFFVQGSGSAAWGRELYGKPWRCL